MEDVRGTFADGNHFLLSLVDGRLKLSTEDIPYEFHLEDLLDFTWKENPYGPFATPLLRLKYALTGKYLHEACLVLSSWLNSLTLEDLMVYWFYLKRGEDKHYLITFWNDLAI